MQTVQSLLKQLAERISECMLRDRQRLRQKLHRLQTDLKNGKAVEALSEQLAEEIRQSSARRQRRLELLPVPGYPEHLPVVERRGEIAQAIGANQVIILCGETGSGKTTQIPKICLELKRGGAGMIGCTQPRRIAARSVAMHIARELKSELGHAVGYQVRFHDKLSADTYIKVMTDGILLAETQGDRGLAAYDTIIIDEAHERNLNIDFLLGYLQRLLPKRPDLKLIITSATIDAGRFSRHFGNAPVVEVSGRTYPVEMRYRPIEAGDEEERGLQQAILDAVDELSGLASSGDILVFLPGEREIRETAENLRKHHPPHTEILPLYARLSVAEQDRVFKPSGARRIVLATNVAETSLTVPGIRYVIDPGLARVNRYSYRNKVAQLRLEKISRASANQRAGRCGRLSSGVCIRLYDENDFNARPEFTDPEILRTSLAGVILRMKALGLGNVEDFPFIEPPSQRMISDGYQLLGELGAVDEQRELTGLGQQLARFPIDPKIARMILAAKQENCLTEMLVIASALSVQDPRERPLEAQAAADEAHRKFMDERSDFSSLLKLWEFFEEALKHKKSNRKLAQLCREHFLSFTRMREWRDIHGQLDALAAELGWRANEVVAGYDEIHRALLAGLLGNIGMKQEEGDYGGARGIKFHIFPGSALHRKKPKWVMAAELAETTRLYARTVAAIQPEWVEQIAGRLCQRTYHDPRWEKNSAQVVAFEQVTLYGLIVNPRRKVHYGPIDPKLSREIFIRSALVEGEFETRAPFFAHNRRLIAEIEELEHKSRRQDVLVDEHAMFGFYDEVLPHGIHNGAAFEQWRKEAERENPELLYLTREKLMQRGAADITEEQFPDRLIINGSAFPLKYRFEHGHALDGVTLTVPLHLLNQLDARRFEWLVPGMVREKATWLIKALPKHIRRLCVPVPDFVTAALMEISPSPQPSPARGEGASLVEALVAFIRKKTGLEIQPDVWKEADLPAHLRMNFRVVDEAGSELAGGRDLAELKAKLGQAAQLTFARVPEPEFGREGLTSWDFGDLPGKIVFTRGGQQLTGYPALQDEGDSVAIRLFDTQEVAQAAMRNGVRRLLRLALREHMKQLEKNLPGFTQTALQFRAVASPDDLKEDLLTAITDRAFIGDDPLPRTEKEFAAQKDRARTRLHAVADAACKLAAGIATEYQAVQGRLAGKLPGNVAADIREQLLHLIYKGFLSATPWEQLQQLPRYLKAMQRRLEKYPAAPERDARWSAIIRGLWQNCQKRLEKHRKDGVRDPELEKFRWMIEELRVSLFAQELKTPYPVSVKRMQKMWEGVKP